jgi:undecaprenyl-diphosphatase
VLRLVVAGALYLGVVLTGWLFGDVIVDNVSSTMRGLDTIDGSAVAVAATIAEIVGLLVLGSGLIVALVRRQWLLAASAVIASAVAVLLLLIPRGLLDAETQVARVDESLALFSPSGVATAAGLAAVTAFVTAAAPWSPRRWRRLAWAVVVVLTVVRVVVAPVSFDTIVALLAGWTAGAAAVVVFGAPSRRPSQSAIISGLGAVGVSLADIDHLAVDARGSTPYLATTTDGRRLFVKALGADERSADLLFRIYRRAHASQLGDERPFSSLRRMVEHEALVALAARELGVRTPRLVAFATAEPNGFVLAYEAVKGRSLDQLEPEEMTDGVLHDMWEQLAILHDHHLAHRDLRLANLFLADDGQVWIIDFGFSELAASAQLLATDVAEALASSSTSIGPERAVAAGVTGVGADAVAGALDRLRLPVLAGATRTAFKASPGALDDLRRTVERTTSPDLR